MAAPRTTSTSLRALRILSRQSTAITPSFRRSLHITGANSAQPVHNPADRASLFSSLGLPELKVECQRRSITVDGSKSELVERLFNHDMLQSRAFSIAMKRINGNAFSSQTTTRHFNTSKSAKDASSTVDAIHLPSMADMESAPPHPGPGIPILPDNYSHTTPEPERQTEPDSALKPVIHTVADNAASPISEVVDNESADIDPFTLTETVGRSRQGEELKKRKQESPEKGTVKEFWTGLLDDILGPKRGKQ